MNPRVQQAQQVLTKFKADTHHLRRYPVNPTTQAIMARYAQPAIRSLQQLGLDMYTIERLLRRSFKE